MPHSSILEKCCSIGEVVGGDPSHFMAERALAALGLDWRFLSFEVSPERLQDALTGVDALGFRGVWLLGALRDQGALALARTEHAARTGRATHLMRKEGELLADDVTGPALIEALKTEVAEQGDPAGKRVVLLGAGGAGPSVADSLVEHGIASIGVADRDPKQATALMEMLRTRCQMLAEGDPPEVYSVGWEEKWLDLPDTFDWILSTASWPKEENQRVADLISHDLAEGQLLVDLAVGSSRSPLLLVAEERGAKVIDGLPILVAETALALEAWSGKTLNRTTLRDAAEEFLGV